jgi:Ni/Co efflux regulator RcnB
LNRRLLITSALASLVAPALALAQGQPQTRPAPGGGRPPSGGGHPGGGKPPPRPNPGDHHGGRPPARPPHGGRTPPRPTPLPGPYRPGSGRPPHFRPIHGRPYRYPDGYRYRRWTVGLTLPAIFLTAAYFFDDAYQMGLGGAPYGYRWVRYGPDLLLVQLGTGRIVDVIYGAFY